MKNVFTLFLGLFLIAAGSSLLRAEEPTLPAGLAGAVNRGSEEPELPAGLEDEGAGEPKLPPGLAPEEAESGKRTGGEQPSVGRRDRLGVPLHGFLDARLGPRLRSDATQSKDATLGEVRLQLETTKYLDAGSFDLTGDLLIDGIAEELDFDLRQARFTFSPMPSVDVRAGRQVLSWGTGDLLFINDLFPKDWVSFLSGRDVEYLKAPGDVVKLGWFRNLLNLDIVYTPRFDPDRFIDGERLSYWNGELGMIAGEDHRISAKEPDDWFDDDEIAVRIYRNVAGYEFAMYGYSGFWKSPAGQDPATGRAIFPKLNVYGASLQGPLGPGIANMEFGYYDSREDRAGDDPMIDNSEIRFLIGYEQELAREFTGSFQYYLEHMQDYTEYREGVPPSAEPRDEDRHLLTLRLTKLLMNQDLTLSLFTFYSPSDRDAYFRPQAGYKIDDSWTVLVGGNLFFGEERHTFFGRFEDNSNVYVSLRHSF
jgi:hypothetical protein